MDGANSFIKMVDIMMENGKRIKCMDGENSFTREDSLLIKATGLMTSSMDMGRFITIIL